MKYKPARAYCSINSVSKHPSNVYQTDGVCVKITQTYTITINVIESNKSSSHSKCKNKGFQYVLVADLLPNLHDFTNLEAQNHDESVKKVFQGFYN